MVRNHSGSDISQSSSRHSEGVDEMTSPKDVSDERRCPIKLLFRVQHLFQIWGKCLVECILAASRSLMGKFVNTSSSRGPRLPRMSSAFSVVCQPGVGIPMKIFDIFLMGEIADRSGMSGPTSRIV